MSQRTMPPSRAEHVGSLIRPPELVKARADFASGRISAAELRTVEDDAIRAAVRSQEAAGMRVVTDGELRRQYWNMDFFKEIDGVTERSGKFIAAFRNEARDVPAPRSDLYVTGRLALRGAIFGEHFRFLKSVAAPDSNPKISIPSPSLLHRRGGSAVLDGGVYPDLDAFMDDLVVVYEHEIAALSALGCTYLQIDDTSFAALCDPAQRAAMSKTGVDGERLHLTYIDLINRSLAQKPKGMAVAIHTCRGNYRGAWLSTGGYDFLAEAMFNGLEVDGFFLEYDDERSGGFAPLRFVPKDKTVVLGLVTTKKGSLESKDDLKRRIDEATKFIPIEQLCLSPQCGFSCSVESEAMTADEQSAKLRLVADTARDIWG